MLLAQRLLLAGVVVTAAAAGEVRAQTCDGAGEFPCGFQIEDVGLQPVPQVFKFQARISQAKLPVGSGLFNRVLVNLKRGDETLCREEFTDVQVQESVLNLEIGRGMNCELDQVIAENAELAFQVCIGGAENCLRPVALASTPYAVKSTFSTQSQTAFRSDVSGQANYAHRVTADRDLFITKEIGTGYFDFFTPAEAPLLYNSDEFKAYENGGFLQWTPADEADPTLHICAKDDATDDLIPLEELVIEANATRTTGRVEVGSGGIKVQGSSSFTGNATVKGQMKID